MLQGINIKTGCEFDEMVEREYDLMMKYYHLQLIVNDSSYDILTI